MNVYLVRDIHIFPKFQENPPITFRVIRFTVKRTGKRRSKTASARHRVGGWANRLAFALRHQICAVSQTSTNHLQIATWAAQARETVAGVARPSLINLPIGLAAVEHL